jgi:hypothetical protein
MRPNERHVTRVYFPAMGVGRKQKFRFETLPMSIRFVEGKVNLAFVELRHRRDFCVMGQ